MIFIAGENQEVLVAIQVNIFDVGPCGEPISYKFPKEAADWSENGEVTAKEPQYTYRPGC